MQKWEYHAAGHGPESRMELLPFLNAIGGNGWELVSAVLDPDGSTMLYFKRPIDPWKGFRTVPLAQDAQQAP